MTKYKNTILKIDTSSNKEVIVGLETGGKQYNIKSLVDKRTQAVLPIVEQLLNEHKLTLNDLTAIHVNPGPGSFTGIRVGISIANALGFMLKIPINGKKVGEMVEPVYS